MKDPDWDGYRCNTPSYQWKLPSIWKPDRGQAEKIRLIDYFTIQKHERNILKTTNLYNTS
jgi:hypothetical protein